VYKINQQKNSNHKVLNSSFFINYYVSYLFIFCSFFQTMPFDRYGLDRYLKKSIMIGTQDPILKTIIIVSKVAKMWNASISFTLTWEEEWVLNNKVYDTGNRTLHYLRYHPLYLNLLHYYTIIGVQEYLIWLFFVSNSKKIT